MYIQKVLDSWKFWLSQSSWKKWTFLPRDLRLSKFQIWNLEISSFEKTKYAPFISFPVKVTNDWWYIFVVFTHQGINEYEWIYDWTLMPLMDFREPLLSFELIYFIFELIYFISPFCHRIKNSWGFRYRILGHEGLLGKNINFLSSWDSWNFKIFWAFCLYWSCPAQNFSTTIWVIPVLQILKKLWSFII